MKKKALAAVLAVLVAGMGSGCGSKPQTVEEEILPADDSASQTVYSMDTENENVSETESARDFSEADISLVDVTVADEAASLKNEYVIYCPDETLHDLFEACYPGYEVVSEPASDESGVLTAEGMIGEMQIHWIITDYLADDEKAGHLDELLVRQQTEGASDYDWVDLFVVDELNIEKYIGDEVDVAMDMGSLGISRHDMKEQIPYTQQLGSDHRKQRGAAYDISPGVFLFRRSVAKAVLGTDDPDTVGKAVSDWEAFRETAEKAGQAGYKMLAGYDAAFDVYAQSVEEDWYSDDGSLHIDDHLMEWVETTKTFAEKGICGDDEIASDAWYESIRGKGDVFGYFLSAEEIDIVKKAVTEDNVDSYGDWGIVSGPGKWYRGGTWLCAAVGTPNPDLSAEIIRNLTCNAQVMEDIYKKTGLTVNNRQVLLGNVPDEREVSDSQVDGNAHESADMSEGRVDGNAHESADMSEGRVDGNAHESADMSEGRVDASTGGSADVPSDSSTDLSMAPTSDKYEISVSDESVAKDAEKKIGLFLFDSEDTVGDAFCDPFFAGQQTGPVYLEAAKRLDDPVRDGERWILDDMFQEAYYPYFRGECSANDSLAAFYQDAKGLIIMEDEEW